MYLLAAYATALFGLPAGVILARWLENELKWGRKAMLWFSYLAAATVVVFTHNFALTSIMLLTLAGVFFASASLHNELRVSLLGQIPILAVSLFFANHSLAQAHALLLWGFPAGSLLVVAAKKDYLPRAQASFIALLLVAIVIGFLI